MVTEPVEELQEASIIEITGVIVAVVIPVLAKFLNCKKVRNTAKLGRTPQTAIPFRNEPRSPNERQRTASGIQVKRKK